MLPVIHVTRLWQNALFQVCLVLLAGNQLDLSLLASPAYTTHLVTVLAEDLIGKQTALDKLQRAVLKAEGSLQVGLCRAQDAEKRSNGLAADLSQLRKLLHEERSSSKVCNITHHLA